MKNWAHWGGESNKISMMLKTKDSNSGAGAGLAQGQGWRSGGDRENNYTR